MLQTGPRARRARTLRGAGGCRDQLGHQPRQVKPSWTLALEPRPVSCPRGLISTPAGGGQAGAGIQLLVSTATESQG